MLSMFQNSSQVGELSPLAQGWRRSSAFQDDLQWGPQGHVKPTEYFTSRNGLHPDLLIKLYILYIYIYKYQILDIVGWHWMILDVFAMYWNIFLMTFFHSVSLLMHPTVWNGKNPILVAIFDWGYSSRPVRISTPWKHFPAIMLT